MKKLKQCRILKSPRMIHKIISVNSIQTPEQDKASKEIVETTVPKQIKEETKKERPSRKTISIEGISNITSEKEKKEE